MRSKLKPYHVYGPQDWRPIFVIWPRRLRFSVTGQSGQGMVRVWVWFETIEYRSKDGDGRAPWLYRLKVPA